MKLLKRVIVSCWVLAAVLWGINTLIDWKAQESSRVEDRVRKLLEIQREELNIMVTGYSLDADLDLIGSPFLYRFYENGEKIRWSDNKKLPAYSQIRQPDSLYYLEHMSGKYLVQRRSIEKEDVVTDIFSVLILQKDFQIRNKFLQTLVNDKVFRNKPENISADKGTPITYKGTELFRIVPSGKAGSGLPLMVAGLVLLSIPFLIRLFLLWLRLRLSRVLYIVVSVLAVIVVPGLMLWFSIPADWFGIGLFDPVIYVSTIMDFTLGEILIAYTFLVTAASILTNNISNKSLGKIPSTVRIFFMTLATLFIYANMAAFYLIISDIMKHSQIVFDITDTISFSWERTVAFIIILLASVFYFMLNHVLARWISQLQIGGGLYLIMHLGCLTFFIYQFPGLFPLGLCTCQISL